MNKKDTKANRILSQARERMEIARQGVETAESQLGIARAAFNAHQMAYEALERELAPTPRKMAKKPAASPAALKEPAKTETVPPGLYSHAFEGGSICLAPADNAIHDPEFEYAGHHPFEAPKPAKSSGKKSKRKSEATSSIQSIEGETESALVASSGGD